MMALSPRPGFWRELTRRAYVDPSSAVELRYLSNGVWSKIAPRVMAGDHSTLAVILPSLVPVDGAGSAPSCLQALARSVQRLRETPPEVAILVVCVVQDRPGASRRERALEHLLRVWADSPCGGARVPFVGVSISVASKILALNCTISLLDVNACTAIAWFDDDIEIDSGCLAEMWREYDPEFQGIYGARKTARGDRTRFSRWWALVKNAREPVNRYPHGCAVLVSRQVFGTGIPLEYITDDHYYHFRFLNHRAEEPLALLRVVERAIVRVPMPNSVGDALRRLRRNYGNVQRVLADVEDETRRYFMRRLHIPGLCLPRSVRDLISPQYWLRLIFHAGKLSLWLVVRAEILLRGALCRPRRSVWFSAARPAALRGRLWASPRQ